MRCRRIVTSGEATGDGGCMARCGTTKAVLLQSIHYCLSYLKRAFMKPWLLSCLASLLLLGIQTTNTAAPRILYKTATKTQDSVYICYSNTSYAYHSSPNCRGLNRCAHTIIKVSLKEATGKYRKQARKLFE